MNKKANRPRQPIQFVHVANHSTYDALRLFAGEQPTPLAGASVL